MSETAMETDGVILLDGNGEPQVQKRCFTLVARTEREMPTQLIEEGNALGIYWTYLLFKQKLHCLIVQKHSHEIEPCAGRFDHGKTRSERVQDRNHV